MYSLNLRYKWMTYGEAGAAREAIGSGLRVNGLQKVSYSKSSITYLLTLEQFHELYSN